MPKLKSLYICSQCGYETPRWLGKCPSCEAYNTLEEEVREVQKSSKQTTLLGKVNQPQSLNSIAPVEELRTPTKIGELDRVLSGGIVEGSLTLVGGDPGIGKSTLLLQLCQAIGSGGKKILYVSGEESVAQINMRAKRLEVTWGGLLLLSETSLASIIGAINQCKPWLVIIDSIQTIYNEEIGSLPGSVTQVRECTQALMKLAKSEGISIFIVGHVTKEGSLAGPRVLEHMVDTVLYFEGEKRESYRIIRAVKNRFGSTNEIGVFEMKEQGLCEISNPSEYMLSGRTVGVSGSCITCSLEGTRPLLAEVQALVGFSTFGTPRRMATGLDYNRVIMLIAVLEKRVGLQLATYDTYMNIAGGLKVVEPSLDAAVVSALASSYRNKAIDPYTMIFGEIGLAGEIRAVSFAEKRVLEAAKLGFTQCVIPKGNLKGLKRPEGIRILGAESITELLEVTLGV